MFLALQLTEYIIQLSLCRCLSGGGGVSIILLGENLRKLSAQNNSRFGLRTFFRYCRLSLLLSPVTTIKSIKDSSALLPLSYTSHRLVMAWIIWVNLTFQAMIENPKILANQNI